MLISRSLRNSLYTCFPNEIWAIMWLLLSPSLVGKHFKIRTNEGIDGPRVLDVLINSSLSIRSSTRGPSTRRALLKIVLREIRYDNRNFRQWCIERHWIAIRRTLTITMWMHSTFMDVDWRKNCKWKNKNRSKISRFSHTIVRHQAIDSRKIAHRISGSWSSWIVVREAATQSNNLCHATLNVTVIFGVFRKESERILFCFLGNRGGTAWWALL